MSYGPYYESLAAVPNRELSTYLPGRNAAEDAKPIPAKTAKHEGFLWDKKDFSFEDVLDTINPLQHIPLISSMYRESSGDTIGAVPRVLGDALYGGGLVGAVIGAGTALVNVAMEAITGKDMGGTMMALLNGDESEKDGTALAERTSGTSSSATATPAATDAALAATTATPATPTGAVAGAAKPDNAVAADTEGPISPAEELRTFPGVNLKPAKDTQAMASDTRAMPVSAPDHDGAIVAPAVPRHAVAPTLPLHKARDDNNAWLGQSILSGLDKYRAMERDQDKKPATVDGIY
ncbi:MAG: hypothetical protein ACM3N5_11645 [Candidatus Eiseniibacteriota bacterium]